MLKFERIFFYQNNLSLKFIGLCCNSSFSLIIVSFKFGQQSSVVYGSHWLTNDRVKKRLSGWKSINLCLGGRLVLLRYVMPSLSVYFPFSKPPQVSPPLLNLEYC